RAVSSRPVTMEVISENKSHGGRQLVVRHASAATSTDMTFSIFLPPQAEGGARLPVVWYLSGLTCTHANVTDKGEYRAACAAPGQVPWGQKALTGYLGDDRAAWRKYDAVALIEDGARVRDLLVDVGDRDSFLDTEIKPELLERACADVGISLTLRRQPGYDHSYYFISTFMAEHLRWHAERLT